MKNRLESDIDAYFEETNEYPEIRTDPFYRYGVSKSLSFALFVFRLRVLEFFAALKNSFK